MATKHSKVVNHREELPLINLHNPINTSGDTPQEAPTHKFVLPLSEVVMWEHVTNRHQFKQGASLLWKVPILKAVWPFYHVTNLSSRNNLKNLYFYYHKTYSQ